MVCTADEMMAGRGEEAEEEEGGVHVQGGQYFGTGSYVSYHASIQKHYLFNAPLCSPFFQRRRQLCSYSELAWTRPSNAGDIT